MVRGRIDSRALAHAQRDLRIASVALVRKRRGGSGEGGALDQYVNDRPYAASSFLSGAIADVFSSALGGHSKERPELADTPIPLSVRLPAVPCRSPGSSTGVSPDTSATHELFRRLFEPLGYAVTAVCLPRIPSAS